MNEALTLVEAAMIASAPFGPGVITAAFVLASALSVWIITREDE